MTLAAILAIYFLSVAGPGLGSPADVRGSAAQGQAQDQSTAAPSQPQSPPAQSASPAPASTATAGQPQTSPSPAKPPAKPRAHHKKAAVPDCATSSGTGSAEAHSAPAEPAGGGAMPVKPCPPPIVVIKNGGSDEPIVELKGDTSTEQASYERFTTEQLTAATEENLKKIAGHELSATQQEMVSQIKQFMEQSKSAVTEGDLNRGHNLAVKARLLPDELVKP